MMRTILTAAIAALAMTQAAPARALVPLHEEKTVVSMFYTLGLADELRKNCPSLSPRLVRAYSYLKSIESYARNAGYSEDQIRELVDNRAEKEKLRVRIRADLARRGASPATPEGFCQVGLDEIARDTASGRLLRAN